ncbi:MAG: hypothetical protein RL094_103 [Candidatus Parcubacteria bacterium]|jgi:hypothetical protein
MKEKFEPTIHSPESLTPAVESGPFENWTRPELEDRLAAFYALVLQLETEAKDASSPTKEELFKEIENIKADILMTEDALNTLPGPKHQENSHIALNLTEAGDSAEHDTRMAA